MKLWAQSPEQDSTKAESERMKDPAGEAPSQAFLIFLILHYFTYLKGDHYL